jgi:hypothetical protein
MYLTNSQVSVKNFDNVIYYYYYYYYYLVCWLTGCTPKQKPTVNSVLQCNSSKSDCVPVTGNAQLNLRNAGNQSLKLSKTNHKNIALTTVAIE